MGAKMEKKMDMKAIIDKMEKCFLYLFMLYAILSSNNLTYGAKVISFVMWPAFLLGFVIVLYRLVNFKNYFYTLHQILMGNVLRIKLHNIKYKIRRYKM